MHERAGSVVTTGTLVRLTADSVYWRPTVPADAPVRGLPLGALTRLEAAVPLSQRAAFQRGALRGALAAAALGAALLLVRREAAGGAVGLAAAGAWLGGVMAGQQVESPRPPARWQVVYPRPAG